MSKIEEQVCGLLQSRRYIYVGATILPTLATAYDGSFGLTRETKGLLQESGHGTSIEKLESTERALLLRFKASHFAYPRGLCFRVHFFSYPTSSFFQEIARGWPLEEIV